MTYLRVGIDDTVYGVAIAHVAFTLPLTVLITASVFAGISYELEEAAMTLGCSRFSAFRRSRASARAPGLAASAIFVFVTSWNEVFAAAILTFRNRTLPAQMLAALDASPLPLPPRRRLLPAGTRAARHLLHPQVPLHHVGAGGSMTCASPDRPSRLERGARDMADIRFEGVRKTFGKFAAVDGVDLEVKDGEFMVLLGPSGCGKTTLLRCLAGLERVDDGRVHIGDRDATDLPPRKRRIAMVFQSYAVFPHMKVYDNIAFGLRMQKEKKAVIDERVRSSAELLHIEDSSTATRRSSPAGSASASPLRARSRPRPTSC